MYLTLTREREGHSSDEQLSVDDWRRARLLALRPRTPRSPSPSTDRPRQPRQARQQVRLYFSPELHPRRVRPLVRSSPSFPSSPNTHHHLQLRPQAERVLPNRQDCFREPRQSQLQPQRAPSSRSSPFPVLLRNVTDPHVASYQFKITCAAGCVATEPDFADGCQLQSVAFKTCAKVDSKTKLLELAPCSRSDQRQVREFLLVLPQTRPTEETERRSLISSACKLWNPPSPSLLPLFLSS